MSLDGEEGAKTLGVVWKPRKDVLNFASKEVKAEKVTKRSILSNISKLYDPLGLASFATIKAKVALQGIWKSKLFDWDDLLPKETGDTWKGLFEEIENLKEVEFPRCLQPEIVVGSPELHVFSDASQTAYGAAAYLVWLTPEGPRVSFVSSKARVAPIRHTNIPRLELMAALIASRLAVAVITKSQPLLNPENFSSWEKLSRVTAYCLRFVNNIKSKTRDPSKVRQGSLKPEEVEDAERYWFCECQRDVKLADHPNLFLFSEGDMIRVGSRLDRSRLPYEQVNPVLLPRKHHVSTLIMKLAHVKVKHAGR